LGATVEQQGMTCKIIDAIVLHLRLKGVLKEIKNPDGVGTVGNPVYGDVMRLFIKIEKSRKRIYKGY